MSDETENENRRRIDKMERGFEKSEVERKADKEIQEKNMLILESNLKELLAKNEAAFERLRADVNKGIWVGLLGGAALFGTIVGLVEYVFRTTAGG